VKENETVMLRLRVWNFKNSLGRGYFGEVYPLQESRLLVCTGQPPQWQTTSSKVIKIFFKPTEGVKFSPTSGSGNTGMDVLRSSKSLEASQLSCVKHLEADNPRIERVPPSNPPRRKHDQNGDKYDNSLCYGAVVMKRFNGITLCEYLAGQDSSLWTLVDLLELCLKIAKAYEKQVSSIRVRTKYKGAEVPVSHADVAPQNIFCLPNGEIVFIDFGSMVRWWKLASSGFSPNFSPPELSRFHDLCKQKLSRQHTVGDVVSFSSTHKLDPRDPPESPEPVSEAARSSLTRARTDGVDRSSSAASSPEWDGTTTQSAGYNLSSRFFFDVAAGEVAPGTIDGEIESLASPESPVTPKVGISPEAAAGSDSNLAPDFNCDAPEEFNHVDIYGLARVFLFILKRLWRLDRANYEAFFPSVKGRHQNSKSYEIYHSKFNQVPIFLDFSSNIQAILDAMLCYVPKERCSIERVIKRLEALIDEVKRGLQNTNSFFYSPFARPSQPPPPTAKRN